MGCTFFWRVNILFNLLYFTHHHRHSSLPSRWLIYRNLSASQLLQTLTTGDHTPNGIRINRLRYSDVSVIWLCHVVFCHMLFVVVAVFVTVVMLFSRVCVYCLCCIKNSRSSNGSFLFAVKALSWLSLQCSFVDSLIQ